MTRHTGLAGNETSGPALQTFLRPQLIKFLSKLECLGAMVFPRVHVPRV